MIFGWTGAGGGRHSGGVAFLMALVLGWFGGVPAWAGSIRAVEIAGDAVVIRFAAPVTGASAFVLGGPDRIAIDIPGAGPGVAAGGGAASPAAPGAGGLVAGVRQAARVDGGTRVVIDLADHAVVAGGALADGGLRLTLRLRAVAAAPFAAAMRAGRQHFGVPAASAAPAISPAVSVRMPGRGGAARLPRIDGPAGRPLVVIDPGHGGHDPGAISPHGGMQEKALTLAAARAIRDELLAGGRVRVALTRDRDAFLILSERYNLARRMGAALFISVHCDSADNPLATGASIYTLSEVASDKEAARLAARENKADILAGLDLGNQSADISSILIDLTQRETMNASANFARLLGRESTGLVPLKPSYHRMASLMVLKAPDMPSILFETGYLSNEDDSKRLDSPEGRSAVARGVRRAVEIHFARALAAR